jgi:DNA-directed RNA polymerase specialized sigma24 family protein
MPCSPPSRPRTDLRPAAHHVSAPKQRLTVYLRYYADLDYREIATVLDVAVGTVSATLSAAHRSLRKTIEEVPQ